MNGVVDRTIIAQAIIVLAVCLGTWFVFVEPSGVEARMLENEIRAGSEQAASIDQQALQRLSERLDEVRQRVRQIDQRGQITRDSSYLYSVIMNLARAHDVSVSSLNPGAPAASRSTSRDRSLAIHREISINVSGRYEDIAAFIRSVQTMQGYIELQYLSVAAASGQPGVIHARMTCRAVRFTLPESLHEMLGPRDVPPDDTKSVTGSDSGTGKETSAPIDGLAGGGSDA